MLLRGGKRATVKFIT